jgi:hypothetical protein
MENDMNGMEKPETFVTKVCWDTASEEDISSFINSFFEYIASNVDKIASISEKLVCHNSGEHIVIISMYKHKDNTALEISRDTIMRFILGMLNGLDHVQRIAEVDVDWLSGRSRQFMEETTAYQIHFRGDETGWVWDKGQKCERPVCVCGRLRCQGHWKHDVLVDDDIRMLTKLSSLYQNLNTKEDT